jgi:RND family efflux transporter MFP subunit
MKNKTYTYLSLGLLALAVSCGAPDKKEALAKLKEDQTSLSDQIKKLEEEIKKEDTTAGANKKYIVVGFEEIKKKPFTHYLQVQGKIDSDKNADVSSIVGGTVEKIYVTKGQKVSRGTLLAKTDDESILKSIDAANKRLELLNQLYDKQKRLWDQQIGTEVDYLSAKNNKESAEKEKAGLMVQYANTSIKAPFDGVIDDVLAREGQLLAPGAPAFKLVNGSDLKLIAAVSESYVSKVKVNQEALVIFPDLNNKEIKSRVKVVGDVIDPINRTFQVDLDLRQDKNMLKANMISYVKIKDYTNPSVVVIPVNLIQRNNNQSYVYVVDGNVAAKRFVTLGQYYETSVEVLDGLKEGEKLITIGYQDLVEGQPIKFE